MVTYCVKLLHVLQIWSEMTKSESLNDCFQSEMYDLIQSTVRNKINVIIYSTTINKYKYCTVFALNVKIIPKFS